MCLTDSGDIFNRWDNRCSLQDIHDNFCYNPANGLITNKVKRSSTALEGEIAGTTKKDGHIEIKHKRRLYQATHIIWVLYYNKWPDYLIDHIDRNRSNNRIDNLREATLVQNSHNRTKYTSNTTGAKGVSIKDGKFIAYINVNRKRIYLGDFLSFSDAIMAYNTAAKKYHKEFAVLNNYN